MRRFAIEAWGVRAAVEWESPAFDEAVGNLLLPIWTDQPELSVDDVFSLTGTPEHFDIRGPSLDWPIPPKADPVETLERRLHLHLASRSEQVVYVHAGVVAFEGKAVIFPGRSWTGKSTLVQALVKAGAEYLSDEYAIVDRQGRIHPFPRPISLRQEKGTRRVSAEKLGWRGDTSPVRLAAVICTRFVPETLWSPQPISSGAAVLELLSNTVSAQAQPRLALACLSTAVKGTACLEGPRGEASETAGLILSRIRSDGYTGSGLPS